MKKLTITIALTTLFSLSVFAHPVDVKTAQKVATTFLNNNGAKSAQLTDLTKEAGFTNLYIFNAEQGFVVMAADDCVQPILGYSLTSNFVAEDMPENVAWWLRGYNEEIQYAIDNQLRATSETTKMWKDLVESNAKAGRASEAVAPLIQTKWNQNKYYNRLCPVASGGPDGHAYTGCVATAMAQIMKYWSYPSSGVGSHSYTWNGQTLSANFGATTYDWANMADYYEYYYVNGTDQYHWLSEPSEEEIAAIATLMYHCGVSVDMNYGGGGSGAITAYAETAFKNYFNYKSTTQYKTKSSYSDAQWMSMLKAELDASRPLLYCGQDPSGTSAGHAFVCDGYNSSNYFHFNWGWAGHFNGYFSLSNLDTGANNEAGSGNGVYTADQAAIFGIEPSSNIAAPTHLTYTLNGLNVITLTWNGVIAASSYNVYCDGNLVGNTTSTTYSETVPFGTHDYYVRCVDANSQLSLPSNTVTVTIAYQTPIVTDLTATLSGNNANLSWTAPAWCYPETPLATLTYGDGSVVGSVGSGSTGNDFYWGHRYLASNLTPYNGKLVYKISFYVNEPGAYDCYVFKGTAQYSTYYYPTQELVHLSTTASGIGWIDLDLSEAIEIDGSQDLWVFVYDPVGRTYPATYCSFSENTNGSYYANHNPNANVSGYLPGTIDNRAWLIRTLVTDGTYTYNLYDGTTRVASNISNTTYTVNNITNNAAHRFTLKTNYNGGETDASNMVGFSLGNATLSSLAMASNDKMTLTEGSKLTVSGTMNNDNAENLILENGAQLIHNTAGVKATVKKTITPYTTDEDGWNFIASPVTESITPSNDNGLLTNNYDLYLFNQSEDKEWRNIKAGAFSNINHKTGYLYASSVNTTLSFSGTLVASTEPTALTYDANASLKGFNLIGNPYPCNATITNDFYIIDGNNQVSLAEEGRKIAPCEGVFVKATGTSQTVTFTKAGSAKSTKSMDCFDLVVTQGKATLDRARVRFGEGTNMEKIALDNYKGTQLTLWQDGQDYTVAYTNGQNEMPLNFEAAQNGTYSIGIEDNGLNLDYLHLIDNLTGTEIDLLETPSYTFEATTRDYASRFRLLFTPAEETIAISDNFTFYANGRLHILNQGTATLQLVDMTGHIILNETLQGNLDKALDMVPGVYVVRLVSEKDTRSMKIVVD